jgi:hypothetical protein
MTFVFVGFLAIVLIGGGLFWAYKTYQFIKISIVTEGKIIDLDFRRRHDSPGCYYPIFQFTDKSSHSHVVHSSIGSSFYRNSIGRKVKIRYVDDNPQGAKLDSYIKLFFGPGALLITGGIFVRALITELMK